MCTWDKNKKIKIGCFSVIKLLNNLYIFFLLFQKNILKDMQNEYNVGGGRKLGRK